MACRQILPGRRWCRLRPFLVLLALAACLFYQTLTPLRTRRYLSALSDGALPSPGTEAWRGTAKKISARQIRCLFPSGNLQVQKEIEDAIFKYSRSQARAVILYIPSSGSKQDLLLYQHIFAQHGYAVTVLEDRKLSRHEVPSQDESHSLDLFICLSSTKIDHEHCLNTIESHQTRSLQKANALPHIRRLLCRKEGLCQIVRTFPDLHLPIVLSCQESSVMPLHTVKPHNHNESTHLTHMRHQPTKNVQHPQKPVEVDHKGDFKIQDLSIILKVYVLVTSLTPLRAFIHSSGVIWYAPKKKQFSVKLQTFFETFLGATSPQQALDDMKEAISKLLLIAEVFGEAPSSGPHASDQCRSCFQMLTFDIGFSHSMHPVVLEVHEHFDFQDGEGSTLQDQTVKESLLEDTFRILLSNHTSSSTFFEALQNVYQTARLEDEPHPKELDHCLTLKQLNPMICFVQELQNLGQFELLFPSTVPKIHFLLHDLYRLLSPGENLGSVLSLHWLLSNLLEQLHVINKGTGTNLPRRKNKDSRNVSWMKAKWSRLRSSYLEQSRIKTKSSSPTNGKHEGLHSLNLSKETHCSHDKDTLPHIRQISTSPHLDLNPYFDPKIKEYYSEVPFEVLTIKIRAEAVNCRCEIHLDEKKGPSVAKYPLGLGINRINILVIDESRSLQEVVSIYKIIVFREDRPSLPLFDDFMVCGFVQDCGSIIHPKEPCGLQPLSAEHLSRISQPQLKTCEKGDMKGQWIVPCLSCSDNRTCDWRQITWQPDDCQYPVLSKPELQQCLESKKLSDDTH